MTKGKKKAVKGRKKQLREEKKKKGIKVIYYD